jgi:hypothetical protein
MAPHSHGVVHHNHREAEGHRKEGACHTLMHGDGCGDGLQGGRWAAGGRAHEVYGAEGAPGAWAAAIWGLEWATWRR